MNRVLVIAEAGVNHNGSLERAVELVHAAKTTGADAAKFQTFKAERLTTRRAATCEYQRVATDGLEAQREMLRALELSPAQFVELGAECDRQQVEFMSTAFDTESLAFLLGETPLRRVKIPSGELLNPLLLLAAARSGLPIVLSTGMATLAEVGDALGVLAYGLLEPRGLPRRAQAAAAHATPEGRCALREKVTVLHCVTDYPARDEDTNLRAMGTMRETFALPVGLSNHSRGIAVAIAATALGACVLEKHLTLDKTLPGPDHRASLDVSEFASLVGGVRTVEAAMGSGDKAPTASEMNNIVAVRGSLVASRAIAAGEIFDASNVTAKRPGDGANPMCLLDIAGAASPRAYEVDEQIDA